MSVLKKLLSKNSIIIILILLLSFSLRLYRLDLNYPNLYSDEVDLHYKSKGWFEEDNKSISSIIFSKIFYGSYTYTWFLGLTPLGVRLPAALYMTLAVLLSYIFSKKLIQKLNITSNFLPAIVAIITTLMPWSYILSRIGFSHITLVLIFSLLHLILYINADNFKKYLLSFIPLLMAVFYYQSMIILSPLVLLITYFIIHFKNRKQIIIYGIYSILFLTVTIIIFVFRPNYSDVSVGARGLDLAIWKDVNVTSETNLYRGIARNSEVTIFSFNQNTEVITNRMFYNQGVAIVSRFFKNYLSFFSPDFLFLTGDLTFRHSTRQMGVLFTVLAPFLLYGTFVFLRIADKKFKLMFLTWIFGTPIATSLTKDGTSDLIRVITMMPFLTFLAVYGLYQFILILRNKIQITFILIFIFVFIYSTGYFFYGYFHVYPVLAAKDFEYGFKEISDFQIAEKDKNMLVVWDGYYPHYHFRFWQATSWKEYEQFKPKQYYRGDLIITQRYNNLYFSYPNNLNILTNFVKENNINFIAVPQFIISKNNIPASFKKIKEIKYPDQSTAFIIFKI